MPSNGKQKIEKQSWGQSIHLGGNSLGMVPVFSLCPYVAMSLCTPKSREMSDASLSSPFLSFDHFCHYHPISAAITTIFAVIAPFFAAPLHYTADVLWST